MSASTHTPLITLRKTETSDPTVIAWTILVDHVVESSIGIWLLKGGPIRTFNVDFN